MRKIISKVSKTVKNLAKKASEKVNLSSTSVSPKLLSSPLPTICARLRTIIIWTNITPLSPASKSVRLSVALNCSTKRAQKNSEKRKAIQLD